MESKTIKLNNMHIIWLEKVGTFITIERNVQWELNIIMAIKKIRKKNYSNTYSYIYFYNDFYWHKDIKLVKGK